MPSALSCSTADARFDRRSSGTLAAASASCAASVYSRKHLPALVRPARPARCDAAALDTGAAVSDSIPVSASYARSLTKPQSTT
ncbi:hypothetical protein CDD83_10003 [Cordyceps sp. RAO-2017]|nr:hypothetical protein CDD83_10003 [Cordyceps sp. RAO-2017]